MNRQPWGTSAPQFWVQMPEIDTVVAVLSQRVGESYVRIPGDRYPRWISNSRLALPHNPADGPRQKGGVESPPFFGSAPSSAHPPYLGAGI